MRLRTNHASSWKPLVFSAELRRNRIEERRRRGSLKVVYLSWKTLAIKIPCTVFFKLQKSDVSHPQSELFFVPKCAAPHGFVAASAGNFSPHISMGKGNHCHKNVSTLASKRRAIPASSSLQGNGHAKKSYDQTFGFHFSSQKSGRKRQYILEPTKPKRSWNNTVLHIYLASG